MLVTILLAIAAWTLIGFVAVYGTATYQLGMTLSKLEHSEKECVASAVNRGEGIFNYLNPDGTVKMQALIRKMKNANKSIPVPVFVLITSVMWPYYLWHVRHYRIVVDRAIITFAKGEP